MREYPFAAIRPADDSSTFFDLVYHTMERYNELREDIRVKLSDGKIEVFAGTNLFMEWEDSRIVKSRLKTMRLSSWGDHGGDWFIHASYL